MNELAVETTLIPGLLVVRLPVHKDARGWFKEAWQRQKMVDLGLPDFAPVQANVSFNNTRGATRGLHAEPWDKLVSVSTGRAFGAWVDLREGPSFGAVFTIELTPEVAVFVPRGVANSYQTLTDAVAYSYLVNAHWRPGVPYRAVALDDPTCAIGWPVPLSEAEISDKDRTNPRLEDVEPAVRRRPLILGANGQLGRALQVEFPDAVAVGRAELDVADLEALEAWGWDDHDVVLNAAAWTKVDAAETQEGRRACWRLNADVPARLAALSREHGFTLVHYSTDYVYDGTEPEHSEDEQVAPLNAYGQSKAAGDHAVLAGAPDALVLRTSWLIGDGPNFVATMRRLALEGKSPSVVDDQYGRLTFCDELAAATRHLLDGAEAGLFHVSNGGEPTTWFALAQHVFRACGREAGSVVPVSTEQFAAGKALAARPASGVLALDRLRRAGFEPASQVDALERALARAQTSSTC
ncbi:sugar nucleotide-binding protein [Nocardioides sp. AX2bis]|uniref:sugar nucleotide-binding protein n=1 Tax=Nocardioides sp. AX2bis TaxID=2653157 RepID=UPI0012F0F0BB|nr:bifunctional dTDP-4-dehydrorhamnose 3,5-epimerase family protein/NAD(P)-dependent oxidoreductase [Nocardioides sp. AX2bis]VXB83531.1 dTDP-4-dehydrorhamnose reductase [Nocardioides sp. AX2bis]